MKTMFVGVCGVVVGLVVACGPEFGPCGRGNTECELEQAARLAADTGQDVYVDVDVYNTNSTNVSVDVDQSQSQTQTQNTQTSMCMTCVSGAGGNTGAGGNSGSGGHAGSGGTGGSTAVDAGCDAGVPDPIVCKNVCAKWKVSCNKKKTCVKTTKVCKKTSQW